MIKAFITIGASTINHGSVLQKAGYTVVQEGGKFIIDCEGVDESLQDFTTPEKARERLAELLKAKKLWTYKTPFHMPGGKIKSSIMACTALGALSAFIAKPLTVTSAKASNYGDLLDAVLAPATPVTVLDNTIGAV